MAPVGADRKLVEADLAICTSLNALGGHLQQTGTLMERWVRGAAKTAAVQSELQTILQAFQKEESRLGALKVSGAAQPLLSGAMRCAAQRRQAIGEALKLSQQNKLSSTILRNYWKSTLDATRGSQSDWFNVRLTFVNVVLKESPAMAGFYPWQAAILKAWKEESQISSEAQSLLIKQYQTNTEREQLGQQAIDVMNRAIRLHIFCNSLKPAPQVALAHQAALQELKAMTDLCNYISLRFTDPSQDSVDRLRRGIHELSECSVKLEKASLQALQATLRK